MLTLKKGGHRDLQKFYPLMEMDFDSEELIPRLAMHKAIMNSSLELWVETDDISGIEVGYAVVCPKGAYGYALLKYMGVMPWLRGKGNGIEMMRLLNRHYADKQGIVAEITDFPDSDPDHQKKLAKFFARFGYVEIPSNYRISGTKAHVWVKPIRGTWDITRVEHRIIRDFYSRFLTDFTIDRMIDIRPVTTEN